ncbi:MAG: cellulase family glycosylhydrolase [Gaiellaceae bacterium]
MPVVLLIALFLLLLPSGAAAAPNAEVTMMDDPLLLGEQDPAVVDRRMSRFRWLGADRVRVSAFWDQTAPAPDSPQKPQFDAASPTDPAYNFANLDRVVQAARNHGLKVLISITTPAPLWATGDPSRNDHVWKPKPAEFALFASAIASRYGDQVDQFALSNEPNQPGWLRPQSNKDGYYAPHHYRRMVNAAFPAIRRASPRDTILVGELAASGSMNRGPGSSIRPLAFLRAFSCVSRSFHKVSSGHCRNFKAPKADVIGHHPYSFFARPTKPSPNRDDAAIGDGRRLLHFLDRLVRRHRLISARGGKLDVDYTEFGYQTDPPDPYAGISLRKQDRWLQEAARVAWATPRVRSLTQFRLSDGPKLPGGGFDAWREFQTGLLFHDLRPKPSYVSFRQPFVIKRLSRRKVRLWGQVRPGGRHEVQIERKKGRHWKRVATLRTRRGGYWQRKLRSHGGTFRYRWGPGKKRTSDTLRVR